MGEFRVNKPSHHEFSLVKLSVDNSIVLFSEDNFKILQEKGKVYKLGALINISKKDLDEKTRIEILSIIRELNDFSTGIIKPLPNPNRQIFEPKSPWLGKLRSGHQNKAPQS